ncbi:MAG: CaiB/BaiF CoA transferase family protein [Acidimicrobiia bacterium]
MSGPLTGVRVLDLTRVLSGPFATLMLADLGADVIKVESVGVGDIMRAARGPQRNGLTAAFANLNRGKRSVALDFRSDAAVEVVCRLASRADVLVENFRPGVADAMGIGPGRLRALNPRLIYVAISGYGTRSPASTEPAYDSIIQARTGLATLQGPNPDQPAVVRTVIGDKVPAYMTTQAILAALYARERGRSGQTIEVPMFDTTLYYLWPDSAGALTFVDGATGGVPFGGLGLTATADGAIAFHVISPREQANVHAALGLDPDDPTSRNRWPEVIGTLTTAEAVDRLRSHGVGCSATRRLEEVLDDEHVVATELMHEWEHPGVGLLRYPRHPVSYETTQAEQRDFVPGLGEHTREVLREVGYSDVEIDGLRASSAVDGFPAEPSSR